ncbi:MAG: hypothetical protein C5B58_02980 [Acidobacteria bacterium]|nr:MAG: hypothetical protein C5B58_02980 [Acidobacteriota bacterium]
MRKAFFVCAAFAFVDVALAQPYVPLQPNPPPMPGPIGPGREAPSYAAPDASTGVTPGYQWRDDRADTNWRNNTWREDRFDSDLRNRNWQTRRGLEDWRRRDDYAKQRNPDDPVDRGNVECGKGAGSSSACANYPTPTDNSTRKSENSEEDQKPVSPQKQKPAIRGVENCGQGGSFRRC